MRKRIAILISGKGSNMLAIARNCAVGLIDAEVSFVASDNLEAPGLTEAEKLGLKTHFIPYNDQGKYKAEENLEGLILDSRTEWLILAGFMRVISPGFVSRMRDRIVNIHPSLLPAFPGKNSIRRALDHGVVLTGVTVHLVDEQVDHGKIIAQEPVRIFQGDTAEDLEERIHQTEHILYTRTLIQLLGSSR